eukprot:TRINITY_DN8206_c0_g1_i7.p1 TRINITY_DN8206_c0_g1~~TRINITY_DN8206_c0_g1_i7.p1  ORF type:complete len:263 (-),score=55.94 TRINITY_DN8206_c0_g1_i7:225-1013(-)
MSTKVSSSGRDQSPLKDYGDYFFSDSEDSEQFSDISEGGDYNGDSSGESSARWVSNNSDFKEEEMEGTRVRVGLYVVILEGGLSLASLITWPAFLSNEPMSQIVQSICRQFMLVQHLTTTLNNICEPLHTNDESPRWINADDDLFAERKKKPTVMLSDTLTNETKPYNCFSFDELTEMQNEHHGIHNPEADLSFSSTINWAHDLFSEHPETTKIVLRNHMGSFLCRRYFGKETFFQTVTEKFEDVELVASQYLGSDHAAGFL